MSAENIELVGGPLDGERRGWATDRDTFEITLLAENRIRSIDEYEDFQTSHYVRKGTYGRTDRRTVEGRRTIFRWED